MKNERDKLMQQYERLRDEHKEVAKHRDTVYKTNEEMSKERIKLYEELGEVKRERDELRKMNKQQEGERSNTAPTDEEKRMEHEAIIQQNAWQKREVEQLLEANEKLSETLERERHERAGQQRRLDDARSEVSQLKARMRTIMLQWKRERKQLRDDAEGLDERLREMTRKLHAANEAASEWQTASADREWKLQATVENLQDKLKAAEKFSVRCTVR